MEKDNQTLQKYGLKLARERKHGNAQMATRLAREMEANEKDTGGRTKGVGFLQRARNARGPSTTREAVRHNVPAGSNLACLMGFGEDTTVLSWGKAAVFFADEALTIKPPCWVRLGGRRRSWKAHHEDGQEYAYLLLLFCDEDSTRADPGEVKAHIRMLRRGAVQPLQSMSTCTWGECRVVKLGDIAAPVHVTWPPRGNPVLYGRPRTSISPCTAEEAHELFVSHAIRP
eukprot:scaffold7397_cov538-Prasinococcus_capsulatus_cf.AAC.1